MSKLHMLNINTCMGKRLRSGDYGTGEAILLDNGKVLQKRSGSNVYDISESYSGGSPGDTTTTGLVHLVQPNNPTDGELWWDGEKLYVRSGAAWHEISGGGTITAGTAAGRVFVSGYSNGGVEQGVSNPYSSNPDITLTSGSEYKKTFYTLQNNTGERIQTPDKTTVNLGHGETVKLTISSTSYGKFARTTYYTHDYWLYYA